MTYKEIAVATKFCPTTIRRTCDDNANKEMYDYVDKRRKGLIRAGRNLSEEDRQEIKRMYLNGIPSTEIANHFDNSSHTILAVLRSLGVPIRQVTFLSQSMPYDIDKIFTYRKPDLNDLWTYEEIRSQAKEFARFILNHTPESRERSLALTNLEQAVMRANAAIARQRTPENEAS